MVYSYILHYLSTLLDLLFDVGIWILLGFIIAAFVEEFVPTEKLLQYFGKNNAASLGRATVAGLVVSVCSCGAIPLAASLRRKGASTATSLTFLLATPWAGFIHLIVMSTFVGFVNVLILFSLSLLVAFGTGIVLAKLENRNLIEPKLSDAQTVEAILCHAAHQDEPLNYRITRCVPRRMFEIFTDIGKYLLIGLLLAAILAAFIPVTIIQSTLGIAGPAGIGSILIAIPIAAVIELCSEGFAVLAGQLYTMGATLAVVFTFTLVGVSTDYTELSMIWGRFGKRSSIAYLTISTMLVLCFAIILALFWPRL